MIRREGTMPPPYRHILHCKIALSYGVLASYDATGARGGPQNVDS